MSWVIVAAMLFVFLMGANQTTMAGDVPLKQGLFDVDGAPASIADHREPGRWLIVMVWATTCHVCRDEFPRYSAYYEKHKAKGPQVLGIALDGLDNKRAVERFYADTGATFPTLVADFLPFAGGYRAVAKEDIRGTPTFMLFNPDGQLVGLNPGPLRPEALDRFIARKEQG